MSRYKWHKQYSNSSTTDPLISRAEEAMGAMGFSMVIKLREVMAAQTIYQESPECTVSRSSLCKLFRCRDSKLNEFIKVLQDSGEFEISESKDVFNFKNPKFSELLSNQAISSKLRNSSGIPYRENDLTEKPNRKDISKINSIEIQPLSQTSFLKTVILKLANGKATNLLETIPEMYLQEMVRTGKADAEVLNDLKTVVQKQFGASEKSKLVGENIITKLEYLHEREDVKFKAIHKKEEKAKNDKKLSQLRAGSPHLKDNECRRTIEIITNGQGGALSKQDLDHIKSKLISYWESEKVAREQCGIFFGGYDKIYMEAEDENEPIMPNLQLPSEENDYGAYDE